MFRWHKIFCEGNEDISDLKRSGRPPVVTDNGIRTVLRFKSDLRGTRYNDRHNLRMAVRSNVSHYEKDWYRSIFRQWVERHHKCVRSSGEYFEKL